MGDMNTQSRTDRVAIVLGGGALLLALPLAAHGIFALVAMVASGQPSPFFVGVAVAMLVLPVLGGLTGWAYARHRRYPAMRRLRHSALGSLVLSVPLTLLLVAAWALLVIGLSR
jgi:hypothetical protein